MPDDDPQAELAEIVRATRQRLEALRRAGVDRMPTPPLVPRAPVRLPSPTPAPAARSESPPAPAPTLTPAAPRVAPAEAPAPRPQVAASLFEEPALATPAIPPEARQAALDALAAEVAACTLCPLLAPTRTQTVFGSGSPTARLMFVGEAPGADEDRLGLPFVGRSGALLTDMITKGMGLAREAVYIANVVKSRPPDNRNPLPEEVGHCLPFLERQVAIVRPEFLCVLGKVAASALLDTALPLGKLRGRWHRYKGIPTVVTYHPSFLLRTPTSKKDAWDDLQMLMQAMGLKPPAPPQGLRREARGPLPPCPRGDRVGKFGGT